MSLLWLVIGFSLLVFRWWIQRRLERYKQEQQDRHEHNYLD